MSAVVAPVELCMLFPLIVDDVIAKTPIARRFEANSLFENVRFDPPPKFPIALLLLPTNLFALTVILLAPKLVSIPVPPSGPGLLLFWIRLCSTFAGSTPVLSISMPMILF